MAVEDIKQMFNQLIVGKLNISESAVMPISALRGCALFTLSSPFLPALTLPHLVGTVSEMR
jgi:hypothetical protein